MKLRKTDTLELAPGLLLPLSIVTEKLAILAQSGAGKSYTGMRLAELMLGIGAQVIAMDPVGVWWSLLASADGKGPGFPVYVFGGAHAHFPLDPKAGAALAELLVETGISAVLDVSDLLPEQLQEFTRAFMLALLRKLKTRPRPLHLFMEEAHNFVPQRLKGSSSMSMLIAVSKVLKEGRNWGLGWTLISQRSQAVDKDSLDQAGTLIAMRSPSKLGRKAIREWIAEKEVDLDVDLDVTLAKLPTGHAYVWSPEFLGVFIRVHISKRETFDASKTPEMGEVRVAPRELAPVDLERIRAVMSSTVQRLESEDPAALRRRITELEQEKKKKVAPLLPPPPQVFAFPPEFIEELRTRAEAIRAEFVRFGEHVEKVLLKSGWPPVTPRSAAPHALASPRPPAPASSPTRRVTAASSSLGVGERAVLTAVAQHPGGVDREQLAVLTGYKRSTRNTYLQRLGAAGYIETRGETILATEAGSAELGPDFEPLPTGDALREHWMQRLPSGERAVFEAVVKAYPHAIARERIGETTGYTRSSRNTYLQRLGARRLITSSGGEVRASDTLFSHTLPHGSGR